MEQPQLPHTPQRTTETRSQSTPISHKVSGDYVFNVEPIPANKARIRLANETIGHWIGPMPPSEFLEEFLPLEDTQVQTKPIVDAESFREIRKKEGRQVEMYGALKTAISPFCPNKELVYTHHHLDPEYKVAPDVGVYSSDRDFSGRVTCFRLMDVWMELKSSSDMDPFEDPSSDVDRKSRFFERKGAEDVRGQLASYGAAHRDASFRLHSFSVYIHGPYARFLRWGPSSAIITERFDYTENPSLLADFVWRFSRASPTVLGVDPTVREASEGESKLCRHRFDLSRDHFIYKVDIPSRENSSEIVWYLLPRRTCKSTSPFGRGTRAAPGVRLSDERSVFLKDCWRPISEGLLPEGEVYRKLKAAGVPHIASFDRGNDIDGHGTIGHVYSEKPWACKTVGIATYQHYRMTLGTVGRDLDTFNSTSEYTSAIADATEAHSVAYFKAKVLHRDISAGNIIISDEGGKPEGLLIDWEQHALVDDSGNSMRLRKRRTGTWQFMSCLLLQQTSAFHTLLDDRESFLWVLIWMTLRYSETSLSPDELQDRLRAFDECYFGEKSAKGGQLKQAMLMGEDGEIRLPDDRSGLRDLLQALQMAFALRYMKKRFVIGHEHILEEMSARNWLRDIFIQHQGQGNWPVTDKAVLQPIPEDPFTTNRKRTSEQAELESRVGSRSQSLRSSQFERSRKKPKSGQAASDQGYSTGSR